MNPLIESGLAFLLFLPLFAILGAIYWMLPRQPRTRARQLGDLGALLASAVLAYVAVRWGFANASRTGGQIWAQVLAALLAYAVFVLCLLVAAFIRAWLLRRAAD